MRKKRTSIRLMQRILHRLAEQWKITLHQRHQQKRTATEIGNGILSRDRERHHRTRIGREPKRIRHEQNDLQRTTQRDLPANHAIRANQRERDAAEEGSGDVVAVTFNAGRQLEDLLPRQLVAQQMIPRQESGDERRR
jgi:hypothetical protein